MNIKLGEDYVIKSDSLNYILYKRHVSDPTHRFSKGEAKESWEPVGYFGKLPQLVDYLIELEIKESDAESLDHVVDSMLMVNMLMVKKLEEAENA